MAAGDLTVTNDLAVGGATDLTGVLTVADGTLVTNLNADKVDGADKDTDGTLSGNSDASVPTEKAVKTYVDELAGAGRTTETVKGNADAAVVKTGDQTIAGTKTFSSTIAGSVNGRSVKVQDQGGGSDLKQKVVSDLTDGSTFLAVTHGLIATKIKGVAVAFLNDTGFMTGIRVNTNTIDLTFFTATTDKTVNITIFYID